MKKGFVLAAAMYMFVACCAPAYGDAGGTGGSDETPAGAMSVVGKVRAVRLSSLRTAPATLLVTDARGDDVEFSVKASTAIYSDAVGMKIGLNDIARGTRVRVAYEKTPEGLFAAKAIKVLPSVSAQREQQ